MQYKTRCQPAELDSPPRGEGQPAKALSQPNSLETYLALQIQEENGRRHVDSFYSGRRWRSIQPAMGFVMIAKRISGTIGATSCKLQGSVTLGMEWASGLAFRVA